MAEPRLTGLIAPPFTPMHADGSLDLEGIDRHAALLLNNPIDGLFICGSTGESMSLSVAERCMVGARWKEVVGDAVPLIVHAGHTCLEDCKALAAHAVEIGADAVAAMGPCFFKPTRAEDLADFCAVVADAAPGLPFYYYHIPRMTGVCVDMVEFLEAASARIPAFAGVKYSVPDLTELARCMSLDGGRHNILFGCDDILLAGLVFGARGSIGTLFNFAAPLFRRMMDAFESADMATAQAEQARVTQLMGVLGRYDVVEACKAIMKMIGADCGPPRLPLRELSGRGREELHTDLASIGFFDYCCRAPEA
jgi:N-acetylneuraminate lyase